MSQQAELEQLRKALYRRSGGQCECERGGCRHHEPKKRCTRILYGDSWVVERRRKRGSATLRNVLAVCPDCDRDQRLPRL